MRTALLGDIHGNFDALTAVMSHIEADDSIDGVRHMGDLANYGARTREVIEYVLEHAIEGVMGNHDFAVSDTEVPQYWNLLPVMSLFKTRELLSKQYKDFLATLPLNLELDTETLLVHGAPPADFDTYFHPQHTPYEVLKVLMDSAKHSMIFVAHVHKLLLTSSTNGLPDCYNLPLGVTQLDDQKKNVVCIGSVGQPRDHIDKWAKYVVYDSEQKTVDVRAVEYDVVAAAQAIVDAGYPYKNATRLFSEANKHLCPPEKF